MAAVPPLATCAVPSTWISVQKLAEASQNVTCPGVTAPPPEVTVAFSVTTVPEEMDDTVSPPEVTVKAVFVAALDWPIANALGSRDRNTKQIFLASTRCRGLQFR